MSDFYAPRRCYEIREQNDYAPQQERALAECRNYPAYVLLGRPGSGKTTSFAEEAKAPRCLHVTARDFITFDVKEEWRGKTLFIDGLDEVRAGGGRDTPFDAIRGKLDRLGQPSFRLSCRAADWYGAVDKGELAKVSPDNQVKELYLVDLSEEDIAQILRQNFPREIPDADMFLQDAKQRDFGGLIKNPQILKMLVKVVGDGEWPATKSAAYQLACERFLLTEHNKRHVNASARAEPAAEKLLLAAGMLCALLLLARKYGFSQHRAEANDDYPYIGDMDVDGTGLMRLVADTELFSVHDGRVEYGHRVFAEYTSAYYLAHKARQGLPLRRILSLMTGHDGGVVTELRGVYAWLATLHDEARAMLLERDPAGIVLYGDAGLFKSDEQIKLLRALSEQEESSSAPRPEHQNPHAFAPFANKATESEFRAIMEAESRDRHQQFLLHYALEAMRWGEKLPRLADCLEKIVPDTDWWPGNRRDALRVLARHDDADVLTRLLNDVHTGVIEDADDELLSVLLKALYPRHVPATEVFDYLHEGKKKHHFGAYALFWSRRLIEQSDDADIAALLDALAEKNVMIEHHENYYYNEMLARLLSRATRCFPDHAQVEKHLTWLDLAIDQYGNFLHAYHNEFAPVQDWFAPRPGAQKAFIECLLKQHRGRDDFDWRVDTFIGSWFSRNLPDDYGLWCLEKAKASSDEQESRYLFSQCVRAIWSEQCDAGLTLDLLVSETEKNEMLRRFWEEERVCKLDTKSSEYNRSLLKAKNERARKKQVYLNYFREYLPGIRRGTAMPKLFDDVGAAYYGHFRESHGDSPRERLSHFFDNDKALIADILAGLDNFLHREDMPGVPEILAAHMRDERYHHSLPLRAALSEAFQKDKGSILKLPNDKIKKALVFYFVDHSGEEPGWFRLLLEKRVKDVAEAYIQYAGMMLRAKKDHISCLYALSYEQAYSGLAREAAIPLLEAMPVRGTAILTESLEYIVKAAVRYADKDRLDHVISKKTQLKSVTMSQKVHWLAAGFVISPDKYGDALARYVAGNEKRARVLSGFFSWHDDQWSPEADLSASALKLLLRLLAPYYAPYHVADSDNMSSGAISASDFIARMINHLAAMTENEATNALDELRGLQGLEKWKTTIDSALHRQVVNIREARFQHASIARIRQVLANQEPANVADLAALTVDCIRDLADKIRNSATNDWRQYWHRDRTRNMSGRKREEDCRDAFLSDLKPVLARLNINAEPESAYADDTRADIKVSYGGAGGCHIPVEVKCNDNPELWSAMRGQLIEKYTRDPDAHGYGIYLVFWFGRQYTELRKDDGKMPETAEELEQSLILSLSAQERDTISVCVIDCSDPKADA